MSFVFPKPAVIESRSSSSVSDCDVESDFDPDDIHRNMIWWNPEPDYDELLIRLSLYVFNLLTPSDQRKQVAKISRRVNVEDVQFLEESDEACSCRLGTFAELFKKLPFSDQLKLFLSKFIEKFKRERLFRELISSFKQLGAEHQQEVIDKIVHGTPENLRNPGETEEELRLRRFTQLSRDYTLHVYESFCAWKVTEISGEQQVAFNNENGSNWNSCFANFFLGFSVIWFQGQSARSQDMLIEQLSRGTRTRIRTNRKAKTTKGDVVIEKLQQEESEEILKLRRFTELCKKVADFGVQEKFLEYAQEKLQRWGNNCDFRLIGEPLDSETAAELLSHHWTFGVRFLSAKYQQQMIDEMLNQVDSSVKAERPLAAAEDHISTPEREEATRIGRLTQLFNQLPVATRIDLFKRLRKTLLKAKRYSEAVRLFRALGSRHQKEIMEYMFDRITEAWWVKVDPAKVMVEKISDESEEDFRFRGFIKMCLQHIFIWNLILWPEAYRLQSHSASDPYDEFLLGVATIWFKATCTNIRRNPVQLILMGKVEIADTIEKLPEESEEDFRLRRFEESFKQLDFTYQENVRDYIQDTMLTELGYPKPKVVPLAAHRPSEGRGSFDPEWINYKPTNPRDQVAATTTQGQVAGSATTQTAAAAKRNSQPCRVQ